MDPTTPHMPCHIARVAASVQENEASLTTRLWLHEAICQRVHEPPPGLEDVFAACVEACVV
jgi:hypothetical protein